MQEDLSTIFRKEPEIIVQDHLDDKKISMTRVSRDCQTLANNHLFLFGLGNGAFLKDSYQFGKNFLLK